MDVLAMIESTTEVKHLRAMAKLPGFEGHLPQIEAKIASLRVKPKWSPEYKVISTGGLECPKVIYKDPDGTFDAVDKLIAHLQRYKTDSLAQPRQQ